MAIDLSRQTGFVMALAMAGASLHAAPARAAAADPLAAAVREVEAQEVAFSAAQRAGGEASAAFQSDKLIDIHGSGWIYNKTQSRELGRNQRLTERNPAKVLKAQTVGRTVTAYSPDAVVVTWMTETYFETPNPQEVAMAAGVFTADPAAIARSGANQPIRIGPGEAAAPNPYRSRTMRVWARVDGRWQIIAQQATRVGERVWAGVF